MARVVPLDAVTPERVDWLWPGYFPRGKLVILDGDPDRGKSAVSLDLAARISTGSPMPDGAVPDKGAVLLLSAEDGLSDTIRPRLSAAGGDPAGIAALTEMIAAGEDGRPVTRPVTLPGDLAAVEEVITQRGVILLVIDPLMAYLSSTVNAHRDQDIRRALHPLAAMADRTGCTVLVIRHLNKNGGSDALYRGGGSIGIVGASRAAFLVGADPADGSGTTRVLACVKSNLARRPPSLAYRLAGDELHGCVRVQWLGVTSARPADLLGDEAARDDRSEAGEAAAWLADYLAGEGGEARWADIRKAARADGIAERTLQRCRRRAGVGIRRSGFGQGSVWALDPDATHSRQPPDPGANGMTDVPAQGGAAQEGNTP